MARPFHLLTVDNTAFTSFDRADWRIWFYLAAQAVGGVGLTLLLATMLWPTRRRKPRNPLLVSLCFSWWLSPFPSLLILYYAREVTGSEPAHGVCLASAVLTMAQSILVAMTAPALIFHVWLVVQTAIGSKFTSDTLVRRSTLVCLIAPWMLYVVFVLANLAVGLHKPDLVHRALFYCIVDDDQLTEAIGIVGTASMSTAIILEVWTVFLLHQNRASIRQLSREGRGLDFSLIIRVCVFGVYVFLGLCLNVLSILDWTNPIPDLFFSTFGIAVFAVFGTQRDVWRIWKDASRQVASRRSAPSHDIDQSGTHNFPRLSFSLHSAVSRALGSTSHSQRTHPYASPETSQPSQSHRRSLSLIKHSPTHSLAPSLPRPAALRSQQSRPPFILIQSTPDLMHSAPSTPTSYNSPTRDDKSPRSAPWHISHFERPDDTSSDPRYLSQRSLIGPPSSAIASTPDVRLVGGDDECSVIELQHSYPPSTADLREWTASDPALGYDESRSTLHPPPVVVRGDSPVWDPAAELEDGARVWRAM